MSAREDFDTMSPEEIAAWAATDWAEAREAQVEGTLGGVRPARSQDELLARPTRG